MSNTINNLTGKRIKALRTKYSKETGKRLTQEDLAAEIGTRRESVVGWEKGRLPETESLIKLANFFNVSVDYLLCRIDETNHDTKFIHDETGLSESAVAKLNKNKSRIIIKNNKETVSFSETVSSIIEHERFLSFIYRLMQSRDPNHKTIKEYQSKRKDEIEIAHALLSTFGYSVLSPGENNFIFLYDAKQEISGIIDDIFRIAQSENIELRN